MDEKEQLQLTKALTVLQQQPVVLDINGWQLFVILAQIQTALRHPENRGATSIVAKEVAVQIEQVLASVTPDILPIIEKSWHPEFDQKVEHQPSAKCDRFVDLSFSMQQSVIFNSFALKIAIETLAEFSETRDYWFDLIVRTAQDMLNKFDEEDIKEQMILFDLRRKEVYEENEI